VRQGSWYCHSSATNRAASSRLAPRAGRTRSASRSCGCFAIEAASLHVAGIDLLDDTPVLDIKPYVPAFDAVAAERIGWLAGRSADVHTIRADERFDQRSTKDGV